MPGTLEVVDFDLLTLGLEGPPACESVYERENQVPEHPAHWYAHSSCGDITAVCTPRRNKCRRDGGWYCTRNGQGAGCSTYHEYGEIRWERING